MEKEFEWIENYHGILMRDNWNALSGLTKKRNLTELMQLEKSIRIQIINMCGNHTEDAFEMLLWLNKEKKKIL